METKVVSGINKKRQGEFWRDTCPKSRRKADAGSLPSLVMAAKGIWRTVVVF